MKKLLHILIIVLLITFSCSGKSDDREAAEDKKNEPGSVITETGELQAVKSAVVTVPFIQGFWEQVQITNLEKEGTLVKKGDIIGEVDKSKVIQRLEKKKTDLAIALSNLEKLKAEHETKLKQILTDLQITESSLRSAIIDTQRASFEPETKRQKQRLNLKKTQISLRKTQVKIESEKIIQQEEMRIQKIKIQQLRTDSTYAERARDRFTLRAPANGMVEYCKSWSTGKKVNIGDNAYPTMPIISLPDLSQMKILTSVSETDIRKIYLGQKVNIRLDAFPRKVFKGAIISISNIVRNKERDSKIKVFFVEVLLETADKILKPGMTVSCEF
ncbi:efflux RND transporter periplasmic adaptor subunit, partial [bacterium]|nr:efflux RND transporter periplasmic adaptor subunit [bacterium]